MPALQLEEANKLAELGYGLVVLDFWASWAAPCAQLNVIFDQLADNYPGIHFVKIEAERFPEITDKFDISAVPSFLFLRGGKVIDKVEGANAPEVASKIAKYSAETDPASDAANKKARLEERLKGLINFSKVMLFMKGTPSEPRCGFSSKLVQILKTEGAQFESFNILNDEEVRQGLKEYSNWPTFPQLYIDGKLIGGLDIVKELHEEGELASILSKASTSTQPSTTIAQTQATPAATAKPDLNTRIKTLLDSSKVLLFMKGTPEAPQCGFSQKIVTILKDNAVQFNSFNILADEEIRQGLKTYSNWPTYPQLYSNGKLIGGLDIVKEMAEEGELLAALQ